MTRNSNPGGSPVILGHKETNSPPKGKAEGFRPSRC